MSDPTVFAYPCLDCTEGHHDECDGICGCLAANAGDEPMIVGFNRLKRMLHPEREGWTAGGWGSPTGGAT